MWDMPKHFGSDGTILQKINIKKEMLPFLGHILSLYSKKCSKRNIRYAIREEYQLEIDQDVINNFLSYKLTKQAGLANITFGELEGFCKKFIKVYDNVTILC